jgi:tRNA modification GTPase
MYALDDTIVAVASPPGGAARGVVRLSGPRLRSVLEGCFRPDPPLNLASLSAPTVVPGFLAIAKFASPLPCQLYLWSGNRSYTGQPVAEVHTFGSPPLLEAVVETACAGGARPAEPGEFTLRAFLAGRIDLTQAEAVLGVIDAAGSQELDAALKQLAGGLSQPLHRLRDALLELLAHLEAGFDFADEDLPFISADELLRQLGAAAEQVDQLVKKLAFRGEAAVRVRVALVGRPSAGKSSLFNALTGRIGAIVSDEPGTTRDYLTADLDLDGVKCQLVDTAGIDDEMPAIAATSIEAAAQEQSHEQRRTAHVRVLCLEAASGDHDVQFPQIVVQTKCDRPDITRPAARSVIQTSAVTGEGIAKLKEAIRAAVLQAAGLDTEVVAGTAVRCGESLRMASASLDRARRAVQSGLGEELIAAEVRVALTELGKVAGAVYTDDVLDRIFSRFCIGK